MEVTPSIIMIHSFQINIGDMINIANMMLYPLINQYSRATIFYMSPTIDSFTLMI